MCVFVCVCECLKYVTNSNDTGKHIFRSFDISGFEREREREMKNQNSTKENSQHCASFRNHINEMRIEITNYVVAVNSLSFGKAQ